MPRSARASIRVVVALSLATIAARGLASNQDGDRSQRDFATTSRITFVDSLFHTPAGAPQVRLEVESAAAAGPSPGCFTYTYVVRNKGNSARSIYTFGVAPVPHADSAFAPPQWIAAYGWEEMDSALVWAVEDTLTPPPAGWDSTNLYPSPYAIQPGESREFRMVDRNAPTATPSIRFYAQDVDTLPEAGAYSAGDLGPPDLPTLGRSSMRGQVYGPSRNREEPGTTATDSLGCVAYRLMAAGHVHIAVFDKKGSLVNVLVNGEKPKGFHSISWDALDTRGRTVPAGTYFVRFDLDRRKVESRSIQVR